MLAVPMEDLMWIKSSHEMGLFEGMMLICLVGHDLHARHWRAVLPPRHQIALPTGASPSRVRARTLSLCAVPVQ